MFISCAFKISLWKKKKKKENLKLNCVSANDIDRIRPTKNNDILIIIIKKHTLNWKCFKISLVSTST